MNEKKYFAHIAEDGRKQSVKEHLINTATLCKKKASKFNLGNLGYLIGLMHDIGKYSDEFQNRLKGGHKVDHSTAGAYELAKKNNVAAAFCVAGHHTGLPDGGSRGDREKSTLLGRLNSADNLPNYSFWKNEIDDNISIDFPNINNIEISFYIRMLYSCLVDSDFVDTEKFMNNNEIVDEDYNRCDILNERLNNYICGWFPGNNDINQKRCKILAECINKGENTERGIYSLTVPTGGGKTVSSLAFALRHMKKNGMDRIIYVVPYTTIIEQTANTFRQILGDENVLEHHSGIFFDITEESDSNTIKKARAIEDWDISVIVTTSVRFFESLYSNRSSKCRKLHNIVNSVIVFDEAQMIPISYLRPCVFVIAQLIKYFNCTAVLCTATQPTLNNIFKEYYPDLNINELCPTELSEDEIFKRTIFADRDKMTWVELADEINLSRQALCIVNSRKNANILYRKIEGEDSFHLTTLMYPEHRKSVLKEIKYRLEQELPCRVVATSLIEAGVDVDFPVVYRELSGLDSIIQAGGRCNREGKRDVKKSIVSIFRTEEKEISIFDIPIAAANTAMRCNKNDIVGTKAIEMYFKELLDLMGKEAQDKENILKMLSKEFFPFKKVAGKFKLINGDTKTIYIPIDYGYELVEKLKFGEITKQLYREIGQYSVSIYENHYSKLLSAGAIQVLDDGSGVLIDYSLYDDKTGLFLDAESGNALFI